MKRNSYKFLSYIFEIFVSLIVFGSILYFLPKGNLDDNYINIESHKDEIQFVIHNSANDWELFFEKNELNDILTGKDRIKILDILNNEFSISDQKDEIQNKTKIYKSCNLPRAGAKINHGQNILAYQQRIDVPSLCNVERRVCVDGKLTGSFGQRSCKERIEYQYTQENVKLYNEKVTNKYVQPTNLADNRNAYFSTDGKINQIKQPTNIRNNNINDAHYYKNDNMGQQVYEGSNCISPWGEEIQNRQFIKAYKNNTGFINNLCEVELRYCVDGKLEGEFIYKQCIHLEKEIQIYESISNI